MKKFILGLAAFFLLSTSARAEVINSFDVTINLAKDGGIMVTENIKYDFGNEPSHGIFRDIPIARKVGNDLRSSSVEPIACTRDNSPERFVPSYSDNFLFLKIGKGEETITGVHNYAITYRVFNGVDSYPDRDELYWNVTGNEWKIPIEQTTIRVVPPYGVLVARATGFTGYHDHAEKNYQYSFSGNEMISETTKQLAPGQGFSVVVAFAPGTFTQAAPVVRYETSKKRPEKQ